MNKLAKTTTALTAATFSLAFAVTVASASGDFVNTGDDANVDSGSDTRTNVSVNNSNSANISQYSNTNANTGNNSANRNIGSTGIRSGNVTSLNDFQAQANSNQTSVSGLGSSNGSNNDDYTVTNTGDDLDFDGGNDTRTNVNVNNNNNANVSQGANTSAYTGGNDADRNIGETSIQSGSVNSANSFDTAVNGNQTMISGFGGNGGNGGSFDFTNTGDDADINGSDDYESNLSVFNNNHAYINQYSNTNSNSGNNDANRNIGLGGNGTGILTGSTTSLNAFSAEANRSATGITGFGGNGFGGNDDGDYLVTNTGDDLNVDSFGTSVRTNVTVSNSNGASVSQGQNTNSSTGDNDSDRNVGYDGGNGIYTGGSLFGNAFMADANWNWTYLGGNTVSMPGSWWN